MICKIMQKTVKPNFVKLKRFSVKATLRAQLTFPDMALMLATM